MQRLRDSGIKCHVVGVYTRFCAFVSHIIVLIGEGSVSFLSHQHISWLSSNKFVEAEHEIWNVDMCLYTLNAVGPVAQSV